MAVAAPLGPSDARVPCPLCGGLVHPIAGRCKHCKADLALQRGARPAASAALPPLASTPPIGQASPHVAVRAPTDATYVPPHVVFALPPIADEVRPILPPRPTGRLDTAGRRSAWRSWPMVVIVLALLAIATAIVLMVWPPPASEARPANGAPRGGRPSPAPDRMNTNPLPNPDPRGQVVPRSGGADPWGPGGSAPAPAVPDDPLPVPPDDPMSSLDPDDPLLDPFASPRSGARPGLRTNPYGGFGSNTFMFTVAKHACRRLQSCGTRSQLMDMCTMIDQIVPDLPPPPSCAAAQRCLARVDQLDCSAPIQGPADVLTLVQDCADAVVRC